jgi:hypothetical protein
VDDRLADELWERVLASWQDDAAHAAFLEHCRASRQLGKAAARYREEVRRGGAYREDATRTETAEKRLKGVVSLAMLELEASRPEGRPEAVFGNAIKVVRFLAALTALLVIIAGLRFMMGR